MNPSRLLVAAALLFIASPASASQDDPTNVPPPPATTAPPAPPVVVAQPPPASEKKEQPSISIALERVGGIGYARVSDKHGDNSLSVTALGIGGLTPNPFAIPRVGIDYITSSGVTVGGAAGFSRISASTSSGSNNQDVGSVYLYTLTPRVGYRIQLSDHVDLTPRAGLTLAGASASPSEGSSSVSIFALAIGADAPLAFRLTDSFNILVGAAIDYTVSATATVESQSPTVVSGPSGSSSSSKASKDEAKGSMFSMQAWLGIGGYL